ncbi:thioredoxin family protein [Allopusillimonas ginsengisoli]|uniref:thioredoxin family protein n=1 Tax=Allopusillimonas ginsengisoli TaxID=453575 RepID=UPI001D190935
MRELTSESFDTTIGLSGVHVVRFWAKWCGPCRAMSPPVKQTSNDMAKDAHFGEINVDHALALTHRFGGSEHTGSPSIQERLTRGSNGRSDWKNAIEQFRQATLGLIE